MTAIPQPDLSPHDGWSEFAHSPWMKLGPSYVSGEPEGNRIRLRYYQRDEDKALVGKAWFGPGTEGPPGHAHGGSMAALLDEAMGAASWSSGHPAVAVEIKVSFRNSLPIGSVVSMEAWVEKTERRKITLRGRLLGPHGVVFAESEGLFLRLRPGQFGDFGQ